MRIAIDGLVSFRDELDLWRAGHQVPVRAEEAEEDVIWLKRAKLERCDVAVTEDIGAARTAHNMGLHVILFENQRGKCRLSQEILYQINKILESEQAA